MTRGKRRYFGGVGQERRGARQPGERRGRSNCWATPAFDYDMIADAVLTLRYTARAQGSQPEAEKAALTWLQAHAARAFSMRHESGASGRRSKQSAPRPVEGWADVHPYSGPLRLPAQKATKDAKRMLLFFEGTVQGSSSSPVRVSPSDSPSGRRRRGVRPGAVRGDGQFRAPVHLQRNGQRVGRHRLVDRRALT